MDFVERYGPWAIIAGASEGTGREFSRHLAARGIHCVLIARREAPLLTLAKELQTEFGVECLAASIDLSSVDAFDKILAVVGEREVGLFISNAGADPNGSQFLDRDIGTWIDLVNRNLITTMRCCHHFGTLMRDRRRGALLLVGSGACYGGGRYMATYSAAKAFDLCFAESLWVELKPYNVDVLHLVLTTTDTPAFHTLLEEKGKKPPRGLASPEKVAAVGLERLARGPVYNWGQKFGLRAWWRKTRVRVISALSTKMVFGES